MRDRDDEREEYREEQWEHDRAARGPELSHGPEDAPEELHGPFCAEGCGAMVEEDGDLCDDCCEARPTELED